ncbi:MAG: ATP-dependent helicase HrpB [Prosthecobacter sp.]|uniref:ATP-dependent helicase HrpB n=1 Tax=Prosthecobacter sp. TaxID=1965333 RepID=UPI0019F9DC6B|nr:ATP-dependent helicase HrpB [Prosthecobacter sp.]MBE2282844.1 ATP-dependent helicase HrpB [Prosthecobacter sp.]
MPAPDLLPIFELRQTFTAALLDPALPNLLIKAPTGSGKSTQIPQFVLDSGLLPEGKRCIVLQPRRIAARMLAQRVARERNARLGGEVGYQVRFENITSRETRLTYVTEGVMLRMMLEDPMLDRVGCVVIDEFHERHLDGDLVLAFARRLQRKRPDLKIIVMSATLVPGPLVDFMQPCKLLESQGRTFPVEVRYQAPLQLKTGYPEAIWDQAARACEDLANSPGFSGDMLVFMPGGHEIRKTIAAIQGRSFARGRRVVPLHGELTPQDQDAAVTPGEQPKIIVSTNVAETSLTIEGVKAVIDGGTARIANYDARRGINTLTVQKISRASAEQRAGRAGRLGPGIAVRLWPERDQLQRAECELPEVQRLDLSEALLALRVLSKEPFDWFEAPTPASLSRAENLLHDLGAIDLNGQITNIGRQMSKFPLHPRFSRMLLAAAEFGCLREAALCAAVAQGREILLVGQKNASHKSEEFWEKDDVSEFQALLRAFTRAEAMNFDPDACARYGVHAMASREAARSEDQFLQLAKRAGLTINDEVASPESLAKTLLAAFSDHLGVETSPGSRIYRLAGGYTGHLDKDAHIKAPRLLVASEIVEVQGKALTVKLNNVTRIEEEWLREMFPEDCTSGRSARYDSVNRRVMNMEETRFRTLVLASKERGEPDETQAASLLAAEVIAGRLELPLWNEKVEQWITRVNCLAKWMPELEIPTIGEEDRHLIIEQLCHGCTTYRALKDREVFPALHAWLSHSQREMLEKYVPERYALKNGKTARIVYDEKQPPAVSVILQQMYDVNENPKVAAGRISVTVHLLSPAQRPIQTTGDIGRFWREGYPAVKVQLRGRYPKHEWR